MGVMTLQGKTIVPLAFDNVIPADYGFYKTQSTEERFAYANYISKCIVFGLFDNEGHEVLTPQFDSIVPISTDYIITRKEQRYNLYNLHDTAPLLSDYKYLAAGTKGELIAASRNHIRMNTNVLSTIVEISYWAKSTNSRPYITLTERMFVVNICSRK